MNHQGTKKEDVIRRINIAQSCQTDKGQIIVSRNSPMVFTSAMRINGASCAAVLEAIIFSGQLNDYESKHNSWQHITLFFDDSIVHKADAINVTEVVIYTTVLLPNSLRLFEVITTWWYLLKNKFSVTSNPAFVLIEILL